MSLAPGWGPLRQRRTVRCMRSAHLMGAWSGSLLGRMLSLWLAVPGRKGVTHLGGQD